MYRATLFCELLFMERTFVLGPSWTIGMWVRGQGSTLHILEILNHVYQDEQEIPYRSFLGENQLY